MSKSTYKKRTARVAAWACGSLFTLFSLLYLYVMQADLLMASQRLLSKGLTTYSPLWGAVIITILLLLLQRGYRRFIDFPSRFYALSFFPSCFVLGLLTSMVPSAESWSVQLSVEWQWALAAVAAYVAFTWIALHFPDRKNETHGVFAYLWVNFLCLSLLFAMTGSMGNTNDVAHYQLKAEKYIASGQDSLALGVGEKALDADCRLTAMRAFALSRSGQMGDRLFEYPQYFGSDGLLPLRSDTFSVHGWTSLLYQHLGGRPAVNVASDRRFLELLAGRPSAKPPVGDYLLCAYLLDKDLDAFVETLPRYYTGQPLPRHYEEALALARESKGGAATAATEVDSVVVGQLEAFLHFRSQFADSLERANQCRREYGHTYWYYYLEQD